MDDGHFEHVEPFPCAVDFARMLLLRIVRSIFEGELARSRPFFRVVLDEADAAECDDTAVCRGVFFGDDLVAVNDGEGDVRILTQGIDLVSRHRRVEVDVRAVVDVADGDGVRELLITREGEDARCIAVQDLRGHFLCELLAFAAHWMEHILLLIQKGDIRVDASLSSRWWRRRGLNSRPPDCEPGALPAELRPHDYFALFDV